MGIFENLVHPQSSAQMELLKNVLIMSYIILVPYFSVLIGATLLSVFFNKKGIKENSLKDIKFAKQLVDLITFNKSIVFALGLIPMLSIVFIYAQLLKNVEANITGYLLFSAILFIGGVVFVYVFKYSFHLKEILKYAKDSEIDNEEIKEELNNYKLTAEKLYSEAGITGLVILLVSSFFFIGAVQLAGDSSRWVETTNIFNIIFSVSSIVNYFTFLIMSVAITSASLLYVNYRKEDSSDNAYYIKDLNLKIGLSAVILLPVFVVLGVLISSEVALSSKYFIMTVITLGVLLLILYKFYSALKTGENNYTSLIFLFVLFVSLNIYKDQSAFETSAKYQTAVIANEYQQYVTEYKASVGLLKEAVVSGEEIFKGRCLACHKFDVKVVGPAYNETLPKYEGKMDQLVEYILNPYKIDPNYPAMPNQGLKPNEAKAVAEYIVNTYKK